MPCHHSHETYQLCMYVSHHHRTWRHYDFHRRTRPPQQTQQASKCIAHLFPALDGRLRRSRYGLCPRPQRLQASLGVDLCYRGPRYQSTPASHVHREVERGPKRVGKTPSKMDKKSYAENEKRQRKPKINKYIDIHICMKYVTYDEGPVPLRYSCGAF